MAPHKFTQRNVSAPFLEIADADAFWLMFGAILVFWMQAGFAMLEVGSIQIKNTKNILIKNIFDASIGAICWWLVGYGLALGTDEYADDKNNGFFGTDSFGLAEVGVYDKAMWLFQWAFAGAAATIVSGAVAERVSFTAYVCYSVVLTSFIYPCCVHVGWGGGWASAWRESTLLLGCGVTDFAGSGVVHMTGGVAALVGAKVVGPRIGRFEGGTAKPMPQQSVIFQTLGTLILWMGWYGFNGVSTLYIGAYGGVAAHTMVTTTIAAATGGLTTAIIGYLENHTIDPGMVNNGILAGLVGITAPCSTCSVPGAFVIGLIASPIYVGSSKALQKMGIDDVVDAFPIHGACGAWGVIAAGLFATEHYYSLAYYSARAEKCAGLFYGGTTLIGANIIFVLFVLFWVGITSTVLFVGLKFTVGVRVSQEMEEEGMDSSKHGGMVDYANAAPGSADAAMVVKPTPGAEA